MNDLVESPFSAAPVAARPTANAVAQTDQQRAIAEVQAAMMIARMNPRDPVAAMDRILNACTRQSLAEAAVYQFSRGGSDVSGPSIRLAEAIAQQWGNIKTSVRELDQHNGVSTVQAIAWDLETGYQCDKVFQVPHLRYTKKGSYRLEDPRDIYEMVANQGARRLRACILAVIPGDVTEAAVTQCESTMKTKADVSPEAMKKMLEAFQPFGVSKEQIEKRIQRRLDAIQPAQVVSLKKIYASLRDGMSSTADWFEPSDDATDSQASQSESLKEKLRNKNASQPEAGAASVEQAAAATDQQQQAGAPEINPDKIERAMRKAAETNDAEMLDLEASLIPQLPTKDQKKLNDLYKELKDGMRQ